VEFIVGVALALFVCGAASLLGMDRHRVFYPTILIVIASYYMLFAVIDGSDTVLLSETAICAVFAGIAVVGFKRNLWLVVGALAGHGVLDFFHHTLVHNTGVPRWWPGFCLAFDLTTAVLVGCVLAFRANSRCNGRPWAANDCFRALSLIGRRSAVGRNRVPGRQARRSADQPIPAIALSPPDPAKATSAPRRSGAIPLCLWRIRYVG
jgi:hypothetical protein